MTSSEFPPPDGGANDAGERYKAELASALADRAFDRDRAASLADAGDSFLDAQYKAMLGSLDRSRKAAESVQSSAAAVGALFGSGVAVAFSFADRPLSPTAILPAAFLGLAVVLSTVYLAWIGGAGSTELPHRDPSEVSDPYERREIHLINFQGVVTHFVERRHGFLRAGVMSLGVGLALGPAPFLSSAERSPSEWPTPPIDASAAELELYERVLDEVAAERLSHSTLLESAAIDPAIWWIAGAIGLASVVAAGLTPSLRRAKSEKPEGDA